VPDEGVRHCARGRARSPSGKEVTRAGHARALHRALAPYRPAISGCTPTRKPMRPAAATTPQLNASISASCRERGLKEAGKETWKRDLDCSAPTVIVCTRLHIQTRRGGSNTFWGRPQPIMALRRSASGGSQRRYLQGEVAARRVLRRPASGDSQTGGVSKAELRRDGRRGIQHLGVARNGVSPVQSRSARGVVSASV